MVDIRPKEQRETKLNNIKWINITYVFSFFCFTAFWNNVADSKQANQLE